MATTGLLSRRSPVDPKNSASPNEKTPPSPPVVQYPLPVGVGAMPTMGRVRLLIDPLSWAPPRASTAPLAAAIQYPLPDGVGAMATARSNGPMCRTLLRPPTCRPVLVAVTRSTAIRRWPCVVHVPA